MMAGSTITVPGAHSCLKQDTFGEALTASMPMPHTEPKPQGTQRSPRILFALSLISFALALATIIVSMLLGYYGAYSLFIAPTVACITMILQSIIVISAISHRDLTDAKSPAATKTSVIWAFFVAVLWSIACVAAVVIAILIASAKDLTNSDVVARVLEILLILVDFTVMMIFAICGKRERAARARHRRALYEHQPR